MAVSGITGMTRRSAKDAREGLLAKGMIEDIGPHRDQPKQREYRLTLPRPVAPHLSSRPLS